MPIANTEIESIDTHLDEARARWLDAEGSVDLFSRTRQEYWVGQIDRLLDRRFKASRYNIP